MNTLGKTEYTGRWFPIINFIDLYGIKCSLQASSLAENDAPGTSAVWLGVNETGPIIHPTTDLKMSPRMHLSRIQVEALIGNLQSWLKTGLFNEEDVK